MAERGSNAEPGPAGVAAPDLARFVSESTGRIQEIIDSAERMAAQIRADAEAGARTYVEEQRRAADRIVNEQAEALAALAEELSDQAADLRARSAQIVSSLEGAAARLRAAAPAPPPAIAPAEAPEAEVPEAEAPGAAEEGPEPEAAQAEVPEEAEAPEGEGTSAGAEEEPVRSVPAAAAGPARPPSTLEGSDAALLRATQLAVGGSGRSEIEAALRREFGVAEPAEILDRILGPES